MLRSVPSTSYLWPLCVRTLRGDSILKTSDLVLPIALCAFIPFLVVLCSHLLVGASIAGIYKLTIQCNSAHSNLDTQRALLCHVDQWPTSDFRSDTSFTHTLVPNANDAEETHHGTRLDPIHQPASHPLPVHLRCPTSILDILFFVQSS